MIITSQIKMTCNRFSFSYSVVNFKCSKSIYSSLYRVHHYFLRMRKNTSSRQARTFKYNTLNYYQTPHSHKTIITTHCQKDILTCYHLFTINDFSSLYFNSSIFKVTSRILTKHQTCPILTIKDQYQIAMSVTRMILA